MAHPFAAIFPKTLQDATNVTELNVNIKSIKFIVCPNEKCNALFKEEDHHGLCTKKSFGNVCETILGYKQSLAHGRKKWTPYKQYQFIPPSCWLRKMFASRQFSDLLEHPGYGNCRDSDIIEDIYDGQIWKEFSSNGFFKSKYDIGLMLNVDWFRPFKRSNYKVAAIMLSVLNLPREERFKKKWTIIAGKTLSYD